MEYEPDIKAAKISSILRLVEDGYSLRKACQATSLSMPCWYEWKDADPELSNRYDISERKRAELHAEQITEITDTEPERDGETGKIDPGWVQLQRLKVDARKWIACKLIPKKYGDKVTNEHTGTDGQPIVINVVTNVPVNPNLQ